MTKFVKEDREYTITINSQGYLNISIIFINEMLEFKMQTSYEVLENTYIGWEDNFATIE